MDLSILPIKPLHNITKYVGDNAKFKCELDLSAITFQYASQLIDPQFFKNLRFFWYKNEAPLFDASNVLHDDQDNNMETRTYTTNHFEPIADNRNYNPNLNSNLNSNIIKIDSSTSIRRRQLQSDYSHTSILDSQRRQNDIANDNAYYHSQNDEYGHNKLSTSNSISDYIKLTTVSAMDPMEDSAPETFVVKEDKYSIKNMGSYSILRLRNLEIFDRGYYRCVIDNGIRRNETDGWLLVNPEENPNLGEIIPQFPELRFEEANLPIEGDFSTPSIHQSSHSTPSNVEINNDYNKNLDSRLRNNFQNSYHVIQEGLKEDTRQDTQQIVTNELVRKALTFEISEHSIGHCEYYKGDVCKPVFARYFNTTSSFSIDGSPSVFIKGILSQHELEERLVKVLDMVEKSMWQKAQQTPVSNECRDYKLPMLCFKTFPPCIQNPYGKKKRIPAWVKDTSKNLPYPRLLCKDECETLENEICQVEFGLARQLPMIKNHIQACEILPENTLTASLHTNHINHYEEDDSIHNNENRYDGAHHDLHYNPRDCLSLGLRKQAHLLYKTGNKRIYPNENVGYRENQQDSAKYINSTPSISNSKNFLYILPIISLTIALLTLLLLVCWFRKRRAPLKQEKKGSIKTKARQINGHHHHQSLVSLNGGILTSQQKSILQSKNTPMTHVSFHPSMVGNPSETVPLRCSTGGSTNCSPYPCYHHDEPDTQNNLLVQNNGSLSNNTKYGILTLPQHLSDTDEINNISSLSSTNNNSHNLLWEIPFECLNLLEEIGEGIFGTIYKGEYIDVKRNEITQSSIIQKIPVVVKSLKPNYNAYLKQEFENEIEKFSTLSHPNVCQLLGICRQTNLFFSVFEEGNVMDLHEFLLFRSPNSDVGSSTRSDSSHINNLKDQTDFMFISSKIAEGMSYLSDHEIIHCDLSARNCIVTQDLSIIKIANIGGFISHRYYGNEYGRLSITANGLDLQDSEELEKTQNFSTHDSARSQNEWEKKSLDNIRSKVCIPIRWMPPEVIEFRKYTPESDIWSFGILLWEVFSYGLRPYYGYRDVEVAELITRKRYLLNKPPDCPNTIYDNIMLQCWDDAPYRRPSFKLISKRLNTILKKRMPQPCPQNSNFVQIDSISVTSSSKQNKLEPYTLSSIHTGTGNSFNSVRIRNTSSQSKQPLMTTDDLINTGDKNVSNAVWTRQNSNLAQTSKSNTNNADIENSNAFTHAQDNICTTSFILPHKYIDPTTTPKMLNFYNVNHNSQNYMTHVSSPDHPPPLPRTLLINTSTTTNYKQNDQQHHLMKNGYNFQGLTKPSAIEEEDKNKVFSHNTNLESPESPTPRVYETIDSQLRYLNKDNQLVK